MRTKLGQILMSKPQQRSESPVPAEPERLSPQQKPVNSPKKSIKRQPSHISHVNEYNFVCIVNKRGEATPSLEEFKNLQIQNLRLIEENMRLTEWTHTLLNKLRQGILVGINAIQQYKYLQGVNLLYSFLEFMTDIDRNNFNIPSQTEMLEKGQLLKKIPENKQKNGVFHLLSKLKLTPLDNMFTYAPQNSGEDQVPSFMAARRQGIGNMRKKQVESPLLRMLMIQGLGMQQLLGQQVGYN